MYTIYGNAKSRTFRVLWMLEEIGLPYTHVAAPPQSDEIRALSPLGKIPVLVADDTPLTDSVAILTFLADRHGALTFQAGTLDRARQDAITQRLVDEFDALLWMATRHSAILPSDQRVPAIVDSLKWEFDRNLKRLAETFQGPFMMGDTMTIADILAVHCLGWAIVAKFPIESEGVIQTYFRAMRDRDAYCRATALRS